MEQQESTEPPKAIRLKISDKPPPESYREYLDMDTDEEEFGHQEMPESLDEALPEPDKPVFTTEELNTLVNQTRELTVVAGLDESADWDDACVSVVREYFCEPARTLLTVYLLHGRVRALLGFPARTDSGLAYFMREPWQVYGPANFLGTATFGSVAERPEVAVLRFVHGLYAPLALKSGRWPCTIPTVMRDKIFSNINDFLTRATDVTYRPLGILILYVPWEGADPQREGQPLAEIARGESAARDEGQDERMLLIARLEKIARTWIKQIREALASTPAADESRDVGHEFDFWHSRYENLICISKQLKSERLSTIIKQLKAVKSPSISDLKKLTSRVKISLEEAKSNLIHLNIILESCKCLNDPKEISNCLPRILHIVRFVWTESQYYNISKNIERLLSSLSVYISKICTDQIDIQLIFNDPKKCVDMLEINLSCCKSYSNIYSSVIENCLKDEDNWKVDKSVVFNCIGAFEQRCQDLIEICEAIIIYGSVNKINLGGTRGKIHEMRYMQMKDYFAQIMNEMRVCCDYALDITKVKWFQDMSNFRADVAELENTIKNLLDSLFEDVKDVEMGIETLYTLMKFRERRGFNEILHNKWMQMWEIFFEEIKMSSLPLEEYDLSTDQIKLSQTENSLLPEIQKRYLKRLHETMVNASDWLGDCDIQSEVPLMYLRKKVYG